MSFLFKFAILIRYIGEMTQKEFEHIAVQMHSKALHVARIYVPLEADAEDVAGDVMLKLWAMHEKVPPDDKVEHLVGILTRNRAIDLLRTQKQERSLNESYEYMEERNQHDECHDDQDDVNNSRIYASSCTCAFHESFPPF